MPPLVRWTLLWALLLALILVPFILWGDALAGWTDGLAATARSRWTLASTMASLLALDVLLPVPSSIVSTASARLLGFWDGLLVSWSGMTAGAAIGYWLGRRAPAGLLVGQDEMERLGRAWARMGEWIVIVFRAVPVLAEASVIFAGMAGMPVRRFLPMAALSNLGISLVYAAAGAFSARLDSFLFAFGAAVALPGLAMLAARRMA